MTFAQQTYSIKVVFVKMPLLVSNPNPMRGEERVLPLLALSVAIIGLVLAP